MVKVSTSELPPRQVALDIEVEQDRLDRAMEQAFQRVSQSVNIPGFRKGKAPRSMVERAVGRERIVEEAVEQLLPIVVNEAIEQEKVEAYGRPRVESVEFDPLRIRATVPLSPKVELGDFKDLRIEAQTINVGAQQVDEVLERLRESHAQWVPVEREAASGDRVSMDVHGETIDPVRTVVDSRDAEYVVEPEGFQPAPGFADQLLGMTTGAEKSFTLALAEDYRDKELAGLPAAFTVKVNWVKEKELPALDDEFASLVGEYTELSAVREAIEGQMRDREEERVRSQHQLDALDKLVEISVVEVAPQVIEHQAEHMVESLSADLQRQGLKVEQYLKILGKTPESLLDEMKAEAEKRVKRSLALEAFVAAEGTGLAEGELEEEVKKLAATSPTPERTEAAVLDDPEQRAQFEATLRERKGLDRLVEIATTASETPAKSPAKPRAKKAPAKAKATDTVEESAADENAATVEGEQKPA